MDVLLSFTKINRSIMNNKQQTAVKLYTEEQVKEMFEQFQTHLPFHYEILLQEHMKKLTPIELPSDEEIEKESFNLYANHSRYLLHVHQYKAFKRGAKWMRDKLQGGEQ
jgi:hypothetical protein